MDLRPRFQYRLDRVAFAIQRVLPTHLKNPLLTGVEAALGAPLDQRGFMRFADSFRSRAFDLLVSEYRDETFSKLLALKLSNLAVAQYHYHHRHSFLVSRPVQLTVDPTNACQLGCPGCVHTTNAGYRDLFDWPRRSLPVSVHDAFLERMGPFAFSTLLYNYGEPLLNREFPSFVQSAKKYLLFTHTSTNLSMPLTDVDELVTCGLDRMVLSVDGTTPDVYERYRRKGDLGLVFENIRKLVSARKRLGRRTPYLVWSFLTFRHNAHQVRDAIRMARELGVDEIAVETPFSVEFDDPGIHPVKVPARGRHVFERWDGNWCSASERQAAAGVARRINEEYGRSWEARLAEDGHEREEGSHAGASTCDWLYQNVTLDGAGRVMPCCMAPEKSGKHLVFANFDGTGESGSNIDLINTPMAVRSRLAFADRPAYELQARDLANHEKPFCADCTYKPVPYHLNNIAGDIRALDQEGVLPRMLAETLTRW